jgi:hypothetical protein
VIQTVPLLDEINRLKARQKKSGGREKITIDKRVKILLAKVSSIKKVLFRNGGYPEIIVLEQGTGSNARKD